MKTYRVFHEDAAKAPGGRCVLDADEAAHLAQVRRVADDDAIIVIDGRGGAWSARLASMHKREVVLELVEPLSKQEPDQGSTPSRRVAAVPALTKGGALDDVLRATIEIGIDAWLPVVSERSVARPDAARAEHQRTRWRRIAIEALKQCEGLWLPRIDEARSLDERLAGVVAEGRAPIVLAERADVPPLVDVVASLNEAESAVALFVGPEGGWSREEVDAMMAGGARAASMGSRILRAETAMLASVATVLAHSRRDGA